MFNSVSRVHIRITIAQHPTSTQKYQTTAQHFHVTDTGNWWPVNHVQVTFNSQAFPVLLMKLLCFNHCLGLVKFCPPNWLMKSNKKLPSSTAIFQLGIVALLFQCVCVWVKLFAIYMTPTFASIVLSMTSLMWPPPPHPPTIVHTF